MKIRQILQKIIERAEFCKKKIQEETQKLKSDPICANIFQCIVNVQPSESFNAIGGLENVKDALYETLILPNIRPDLFQGLRRPSRGVLMYGPPGNGKTMIAKATANECSGTFFSVSASTLVSKYVGESEKYLRSLFHMAYLLQPSIVFIDEVDSILTARSTTENEASRRLKTEFLVQFDGMNSWKNERVFLLAATNRPFDIDTAVLRRFDRRISIPLPDAKTREIIIKNLLKSTPHKVSDAQIREIARLSTNYSASDLSNVLRHAALEPIRGISKNEIPFLTKEEVPLLSLNHIISSLKKIPPSVSPKDLEEIKKWENQVSNM